MENITLTDLDSMYREELRAYMDASRTANSDDIAQHEGALKVLVRLIGLASSRAVSTCDKD